MQGLLVERALKEWAVVVDAIAAGQQLILLRKGGIDDVGGEFKLETSHFVLWPTYLHQEGDWLGDHHQPRLAASFAARLEGDEVAITTYASVFDILEVPSRSALDALEGEHIWSPEYLDQRWEYRADLPLYLLILRADRLLEPARMTELPAYRGCKSWIDLAAPLHLSGLTPALADAEFLARAEGIKAAVRG
jgi:hypothetical protein